MSEFKKDKEKQSLLEKYNIPLQNLSFEFVKSCSDVKALEKIIKILRSGEEGFYPDLLKTAEDKLRNLNPSARILRVLEPVTRTSELSFEATDILNDLQEWSSTITSVDKELGHQKQNKILNQPVRNSSNNNVISKPVNMSNKPTVRRGTDYSKWDKFDPDAELLRQEIEAEKENIAQKKKKETKEKEEDEKRALELAKISEESLYLSVEEKEKIAEDKRVKGNEYFKLKEFNLAIQYYSESLAILGSAAAFNNRALAHMKVDKFYEAYCDCNSCLRYEPQNVKALFRRAQALQGLKRFHEALDDVNTVLRKDSSNSAAVVLKNSLQNQIGRNQIIVRRNVRKKRILVKDDESYADGAVKIIDVTDDELRKYNRYEYVELNEKNQLKDMCICSLDPNYHKRDSFVPMAHSVVSSPYYRIQRVKHCYPVKVDNDRPSTSAVINSNYLHTGINSNYRTKVTNIFETPELDNICNRNFKDLPPKSSHSSPINYNRMFDFNNSGKNNINSLSKVNNNTIRKGSPEAKSVKVVEVCNNVASSKSVPNLSTKLEILEIDSSIEKSDKPLNNSVFDKQSHTSTNQPHQKNEVKTNLNINIPNFNSQMNKVPEKSVFVPKNNSCATQNAEVCPNKPCEDRLLNIFKPAGADKSKFTLKQADAVVNGSSNGEAYLESNLLNNNSYVISSNLGNSNGETGVYQDNKSSNVASLDSIHVLDNKPFFNNARMDKINCNGDANVVRPTKDVNITSNNVHKINSESKCIESMDVQKQNSNEVLTHASNLYSSDHRKKLVNGLNSINNNLNSDDSKEKGNKPEMSPFQFHSRWQSIGNSKNLSEYEKLLRQIKPAFLSQVISNQLDDQMLSIMLGVFLKCFDLKEENSLIVEYLTIISNLERFGIALCCLSQEDARVAKELFTQLESICPQRIQELKQIYTF